MNSKFFSESLNQPVKLLASVVVLALCLGFLKIGVHNVREWDEARNGVNANEMLHNGDYVNLYYEGLPDTWNAKPPLFIWLIALSYKLFGFNAFALRLPSVLSAIFFLVFCFRIVAFFEPPRIAFYTCLLLLSCKAVFGLHLGLTADFDATLLLFLTASVFYFVRYVEWRHLSDSLLFALFTGLAFYTKGPAAFVLTPGFLLYVCVKKQWWLFKSWQTWLAALLLLTIVSSWFLLSARYGIETKTSYYGSKNAVETMLMHDTFQRLTNPAFDITGSTSNIYLFFFEVLDARFNLWNYVFYLGVPVLFYLLFVKGEKFRQLISANENKMSVLSLCLILPLSVILTFAATKNNWYLAPVFMFVAFLTVKTAVYLGQSFKWLNLTWALLLAFTLGRQVVYVATLSSQEQSLFGNSSIFSNKQVLLAGSMPQNILLRLKWIEARPLRLDEGTTKTIPAGTPFIARRPAYKSSIEKRGAKLVAAYGDFYIGVWKGAAK